MRGGEAKCQLEKYCNPLSAPGNMGRILYYNIFIYPRILGSFLGIGNSKTSPRDYAATCIFFPTLSSAETVQATATIPCSAEEEWLSRCPLKKDSLLGCLPLVTNECGTGLGVGGMRLVMQSSHWKLPTSVLLLHSSP